MSAAGCASCRQTKARDGGWVIWRGDGSLFDTRGGEGRSRSEEKEEDIEAVVVGSREGFVAG